MGILYLVATPIGNLEDITIRAIKTLLNVDFIACEDTRRTGLLLTELIHRYSTVLDGNVNINKPKLISFYDEVEQKKVAEIIDLLSKGKNIALVSDAGTPLISDPGFKLVRECIRQKIKIESVPGPSAVIDALIKSGLPTNQFLFLGFFPVKTNKRKNLLMNLFQCFKSLKVIHFTVVFFEVPHRLRDSLTDLKEIFADIEIVIARELTKVHESFWRGKISEYLIEPHQSKGEFVILFNVRN